jgi:Thioredoxin-like domain
MTKQSLPAVSVLESGKVEEFKTADKVVLIGYFGADDKGTNATFNDVANKLRDDYLFGATNDAALAKAEGVSQPAIVLYKTFDDKKDIYDGKLEKDAIAKFAKTAATPLVGEVAPETYQSYMDVSTRVPPRRYFLRDRPVSHSHTSSPSLLRSVPNWQTILSPSPRSTRARLTSRLLMLRHLVRMLAT